MPPNIQMSVKFRNLTELYIQQQQQQQSLFTLENNIYKNNCSSHLVK